MQAIRIAIAEDNRLVRQGFMLLLDQMKNPDIQVVLEASNGRDLLEKLAQVAVDLVLMDIEMPEMNGIEATKQVTARYPRLRVLALSVYNDDDFIIAMLKAGARGYLTKDEEPAVLHRAIKTTMETGYFYTQLSSRAMHLAVSQPEPLSKPELLEPLKPAELKTLIYICQELTTAQIADKLCVSERTVEGYRRDLLAKTHTKNTAGLVVFAFKHGYFKINP